MSRVAVTGAAGFVGRNLVPALRAEGQDVRGLVRPGSSVAGDLGMDTVRGDVRQLQSLRDLVEGCDLVVHLAASFSPEEDGPEIIVEGTRSMLAAAAESGVNRLIFLSCLGAEAAAHSDYLRAKWKAEQLVRSSEIPHVILRPSVILGRGDGVTQPLATIIRSLPVIPIPGSGEHRSQPVDVADVVQCVLTALRGETMVGEEISVGGPSFITLRQLSDLLSGELNVFKPKVLVPDRWVPAVTPILPPGARALFAPARLATIRQGIVASPGIVQRAFGFTPRSVVPLLTTYLA